MASYPAPIQDLIDQFRRFPGVGPKSAERFVFQLLRGGAEQVNALIRGLGVLRERVGRCETCGTFSEETICNICADRRRDRALVCVVAEPSDLLAVERTGEFKGVYHILGGLLAPIEGVGPEQLRIAELLERVRADSRQPAPTEASGPTADGIREIIFAFDSTIEGETTVNYIVRALAGSAVRLTRIARGIPVGGDLEYADPVTLSDAITGRRELANAAVGHLPIDARSNACEH